MNDASIRCFNQKRDNYEMEKLKEDYHNNKQYLNNFDCCDKQSCDALAYEYEKLYHKCNDVFGNVNDLDEKGRIIGDTACKKINEKRAEILSKYEHDYTYKTGFSPKKSVKMLENPVTGYSYGGKKHKKSSKKSKSYKKRNRKLRKRSVKRRK